MKKLKNIVGWISLVLIVLIAISGTVFRFAYPELTETQLFLKMWWTIIPTALCLVVLHWGFNSK